MSYFYVWKWTHWKQWLTIILIAFFTASLLWVSQNRASAVSSSKERSVLAKGSSDEPHVALTFNIGWGEEKVHDILKQLDDHQNQATFLLSDECAENINYIVNKIV